MKRWLAAASAVAGAVVPLAACASPPPDRNTATLDAPRPAHLAVDERPSVTLDVLTGTAALKIGTANFGAGGALLRVSTPSGAPPPHLRETANGAAPPRQDMVVDLSAPGASAVTVTLNAAVRWWLVLGGGTPRTVADLRGTQVTGVAVTAMATA